VRRHSSPIDPATRSSATQHAWRSSKTTCTTSPAGSPAELSNLRVPAGVSVGDEVFGLIDGYLDGWAAEYVAIEARNLASKPTTVDFVEAASLPQAGLTSWQALFDHGHLESGQSVVIHGAAGGVGAIGVQLAHWAGAHVIGTGRANARQRVLDLGADGFVDVEQPGWEKTIDPVDLVYDIIGGDVLAASPAIVKPGGAVVTIMGVVEADACRNTSNQFDWFGSGGVGSRAWKTRPSLYGWPRIRSGGSCCANWSAATGRSAS
jgi:NADPH:quinone reductase-like Zn-dependent oxidoreductase